MTIKDTDKGMKKLMRRIAKRIPKVQVGVQEGKRDDSNLTNVQVGAWMEFGTKTIPKRSFIRDTIDQNRGRIRQNIRRMETRIRSGANAVQQMELLGLWVEGLIKERISDGIPPPLAQSTIDRKGSSTPLIDTGQLRNSITSKVGD